MFNRPSKNIFRNTDIQNRTCLSPKKKRKKSTREIKKQKTLFKCNQLKLCISLKFILGAVIIFGVFWLTFHNKTNSSLFFLCLKGKKKLFNGLLVAVLKIYGENFCIAIKQLVHSKQTTRTFLPSGQQSSIVQNRDVGNYLPFSSDLQSRVQFESKQSRCFAVFVPIAAQSCSVWECDKWNLKKRLTKRKLIFM